MDCTKTLRLRIKDKHARVLSAMAREVNQVWNFCNETSHRAIRERHQWLSGYDLQKLTNGFSKCDGVHIGSPTVQQVCEDYAKARRQFKKAKLRWRVSNPQSSKYSLGWIPFKARALQYKAGQVAFAGQTFFVGDVASAMLVKTKMAKSTLDAGWAMLKTMLEYKSHQAGIVFRQVNEAYSTQTCSCCGSVPASSPKGRAGLRIREWTCSDCGTVHDRDVNAARNILAAGDRRLAVGISGV